jgi:hypothetical protein
MANNGRLKSHQPVGGPVPVAWREGTLTRAKELEALSDWLRSNEGTPQATAELLDAIGIHLDAARQAARLDKPHWRRSDGASLERALSNLSAAEADLLQAAPSEFVLGQMPCLLSQVQRHLSVDDPRRKEFERIADEVGVSDHAHNLHAPSKDQSEKTGIVEAERSKIVSISRGADSAGLREQLRVRSFRNVLVAATAAMALLAVVIAIVGWFSPTSLPVCFQPQQEGQTVVVCPTAQSVTVARGQQATGPVQPSIDRAVRRTVSRQDLLIVEVLGLVAAAVASAAALRRIRGSSEPHGLPVVLALLKLPTGALTAVLGLLLMRGGFVPGLTALDTSAQILAWAILFGYAQQLFTRFVDQQADTVLDGVRSARTANASPSASA